MSHAHRRMHRRWAGKIPRRNGPLIYCNRKTAELLRREAGHPPRERRWRKREARRQWRARHRQMLNEALAIAQDRSGSAWLRAGDPVTYYGIPIRPVAGFTL